MNVNHWDPMLAKANVQEPPQQESRQQWGWLTRANVQSCWEAVAQVTHTALPALTELSLVNPESKAESMGKAN